MKYIIKNCPAVYIFKGGYSCNNLDYDEHIFCKDIPDCLLKRIIELCKNIECDVLVNTKINNKGTKNRCGAMDNMPLCCEVIVKKEILNLLEIEEVE